MTGMTLSIDTRALDRALTHAPVALAREMNRAIARTVQAMARSARRRAPKAHSQLVNAIAAVQTSPFEGLVTAGTDYARMVEEGTGPQGESGQASSGFPPESVILDWIRVKRIVPDDPEMSQEDLAFVIARSIALKGTPPQPFLTPAFDDERVAAERRIQAAIDRALAA